MKNDLVLASGSQVRAELLRNAGLRFEIEVPRIDELAVRQSMQQDGAPPRDVADLLAEMKARRISDKRAGDLVLGCDQVLALDREILGKPDSPETARAQLRKLRNRRHMLHSAAVLFQDGRPLWRHVGTVRLLMRDFSETWLDGYLARNWESIQHSVGGYKLEEEGVRLFSRIEGDYFTVLGLPLLDLLGYLTQSGRIEG